LPFTIYTLAGSYPWCLALAYLGMKLGQHWNTLGPYFHRFDTVIGALILFGAGLVLYNRIRGITAAPATE
jgi:membrane protein DedA with SNARE-associated domain